MGNLPKEGHEGPLFRFTPLLKGDRADIVNRSGSQGSGTAFVEALQFQLSALGANLDLHGAWPPTPGQKLGEWRQITTAGRDQYVRVVDYGYMLPFGHPAILVTITDRVFVADPVNPDDYADAYLQYKRFIRVLEPSKSYPAIGQPHAGSNWPFSTVDILTLTSPDLDPTEPSIGPGGQAFWPTYDNGKDVPWKVALTDEAGTVLTIHTALGFVEAGTSSTLNQFSGSDMEKIASAYNALAAPTEVSTDPKVFAQQPSRVTVDIPGTPLRYAPEISPRSKYGGLTTHPTYSLTFAAATSTKVPMLSSSGHVTESAYTDTTEPAREAANQPAFYPVLFTANVKLPAAEALSRSSFDDSESTAPGVMITFFAGYTESGFDAELEPEDAPHRLFHLPRTGVATANPGSVFGGIVNKPQLNFPADMVGGIGNPNLLTSGLSATAGAIGGDISNYAQQGFADIDSYFGSLSSSISNFFGGLPLGPASSASGLVVREDLLAPHDNPIPGTGILSDFVNDLSIPNITHTTAPDGTTTITYTLTANLQSYPSPVSPIFAPVGSGTLDFSATLTVTLNGQTTFDVQGTIDPFTINVLGGANAFQLIQVQFGDDTQPGVSFSASSGSKTSIQPNVTSTTFVGILSFVQTLQEFLQDLGGSGISIDVTPTQVSVSVSLSLPSIACGIFDLENLALNASLVVPFLGGQTMATFGFCSQEQPFTLIVDMFGGGGYVNLGVGLTSVQLVNASLDFEGQFALDLGVASGSVSLTAGITFSWSASGGSSLTGFVRVNGEVEVLGILSISLEVELSLTLNFTTGDVTGTATMQVSVSLFCFSASVGITISKTFHGGSLSGSIVEEGLLGAADPHDGSPLATPSTFADVMPPDGDGPSYWTAYCEAFASGIPT